MLIYFFENNLRIYHNYKAFLILFSVDYLCVILSFMQCLTYHIAKSIELHFIVLIVFLLYCIVSFCSSSHQDSILKLSVKYGRFSRHVVHWDLKLWRFHCLLRVFIDWWLHVTHWFPVKQDLVFDPYISCVELFPQTYVFLPWCCCVSWLLVFILPLSQS